ncbi:hypothetical protein AV530_018575 [Patagioenas fasciata monilis]|uniref:Uncharacterized protein n=1 Tax=Patagioenas fasciata monilis TaxID=372326 RepID=A0A1V4JSG7_PATFA|nr:hypothetical protein AV530_018575 [Patagioenas fasciata monilis]
MERSPQLLCSFLVWAESFKVSFLAGQCETRACAALSAGRWGLQQQHGVTPDPRRNVQALNLPAPLALNLPVPLALNLPAPPGTEPSCTHWH